LKEQLAWWANCLGLTGAPFDSYLTLRGLRTLHARLEQHGRNAHALAHWLSGQPNVKRVWYPGLATHPGHEVARRQQRGFGAVVTLELEGGCDAVREFLDGLVSHAVLDGGALVGYADENPGSPTRPASAAQLTISGLAPGDTPVIAVDAVYHLGPAPEPFTLTIAAVTQ